MSKGRTSESTARNRMMLAYALSTFAAAASVVLALRQQNLIAVTFVGIALSGYVVTTVAYRRYTSLRRARWQRELASSERALDEIFRLAGAESSQAATADAAPTAVEELPGTPTLPSEEPPGARS